MIEEACNYAILCASESAKIQVNEITKRTKIRNVAHARFVASALIKKHVTITEHEITKMFDYSVTQSQVSTGLQIIRGHIELFNRKSFKTDIFKLYEEAEKNMQKVYKPKYHTQIPDIK